LKLSFIWGEAALKRDSRRVGKRRRESRKGSTEMRGGMCFERVPKGRRVLR